LLAHLPIATDSRVASDLGKFLLLLAGLISLFFFFYLIFARLTELEREKRNLQSLATDAAGKFKACDLFAQAQQKARLKDWREACRILLLCTLRLFDETGILPFMSARTNYEYCLALGNYSSLTSAFRPFCDKVDLLWFGKQQANEEDLVACLSQLKEIAHELSKLTSNSLPLKVGEFKW
jgi:hypothetical protein